MARIQPQALHGHCTSRHIGKQDRTTTDSLQHVWPSLNLASPCRLGKLEQCSKEQIFACRTWDTTYLHGADGFEDDRPCARADVKRDVHACGMGSTSAC